MKSQLKCVLVPGTVIVGAGPSGLATAACLKEKGIPSLILEREICLASLWKLKAYDCLKVHLPRKFCELPHMKLPPDFPQLCLLLLFVSHKDEELFNKHDGSPKTPFPNCWKGKNGLYSVGFGKQGLKGASIDAQTVAQDIARQWKSETKHLRFDYHMEQVEFPPTAPGPYFYLNSLFKTSS